MQGPTGDRSSTPDELLAAGAAAWIVAAARQLDDAMLRLRFNEPEIGTWVLHTVGDADAVAAAEDLLGSHGDHWLVNEVAPAVDPRRSSGSTCRRARSSRSSSRAAASPACSPSWSSPPTAPTCSTGPTPRATAPPATLRLTDVNDGRFPMSNGLSRLATRFWGHDDQLAARPRSHRQGPAGGGSRRGRAW